ncbi:hypothetical protein ACZ87_01073 [Candidatus Erwinia dacicola]|uniref:Uncharacterized protein n=1 Tax=Candidatus Erwinia dacicola TaxID=252393 RepID=A0A328TWA6_9GAMM|nr:hypothetical protein ACZ87_01073 [Candidatus Erwinia dacicola]
MPNPSMICLKILSFLFSTTFKQFLYDGQGGIGITKFFDQVKK